LSTIEAVESIQDGFMSFDSDWCDAD